jgi:hypothetical protein
MNDTSALGERRLIERAVEHGTAHYIASREARVPAFIDRHFSWRGAFRLHKKALGRDLLKVPVNLFWAPSAILAHASGALLNRLGAEKLGRSLARVPAGLETDVEKEVNWLIYTELLELPYVQDGRVSEKDALLEAILNEPELAAVCTDYLETIQRKAQAPGFREALERNLAEYGKGRLAATDLTNSILALAAGYAVLHKATPGLLAGGSATAAAIAQQVAIANFWLGPTLGAWYYGLFPAAASAGLVVAATGALMAGFGVLAAFSGVVIDPLLARTGFHERRLKKFIRALALELKGDDGRFQIRDQYAARVFDVVDLLRTAAQAIK